MDHVQTAARRCLKIKVTLAGIRPPIWRRLLVPAEATLNDLHEILQIAMGWLSCHLHEFQVGDRLYGEPDPDFQEMKVLPDWNIKLSTIYRRGIRKFTYLYDFGDSWDHDIVIEGVQARDAGGVCPTLLGGRRHGPPEDVGGMYGYAEFLQAIKNPSDPENNEWLVWCGGAFDPEEFDQAAIMKRLIDWAKHLQTTATQASDHL